MKVSSLLKTILLFLLVFVLKEFKGLLNFWSGWFLFASFVISFFLIIGTGFYLVKVRNVKLFTALVLATALLTTGVPSYAQTTPIEYVEVTDLAGVQAAGESVCSAETSGTIDMATLNHARSILNYFNTHYDNTATPGIFGSSGSKYLECAQNYVEYAGEVQNASGATCSPTRAILQSIATRNKCWPCDVTSTIIAGIQKMAVSSYTTINNGAKALLAGIYLMWLAITILISFAKFGFEKFGEFFTKLLNQTIIVMIVAIILHMPIVQFYNIVISPFISYSAALGMTLSQTTTKTINKGNDLFAKIIDITGIAGSAECHYCKEMHTDLLNADTQTGSFMNEESVKSILCLTCSTYRQVAPMISLGQVMICLGRTTPQTLGQIPILSSISQFSTPNMALTMMGYILVIVFSYMMLLVGYFVMASVFKLGVVLVLMPLFIMAYAFKFSRPYASKAWQLIVFSMGTLVIVSLLVSMMMIGFSSLMPDATITGFVTLFFSGNPTMIADMMGGSNISALIASGDTKSIMDSVMGTMVDSYTFLTIVTMTAFSYICISVLSGTTALAEQITNSWQLNTNETALLSQGFMEASGKAMKAAKMSAQGVALAGGARELIKKDSKGNVISKEKKTTAELYKETKELSDKVKAGGDKKAKEENKKKSEKEEAEEEQKKRNRSPFL